MDEGHHDARTLNTKNGGTTATSGAHVRRWALCQLMYAREERTAVELHDGVRHRPRPRIGHRLPGDPAERTYDGVHDRLHDEPGPSP
jgi:hypothetical protein